MQILLYIIHNNSSIFTVGFLDKNANPENRQTIKMHANDIKKMAQKEKSPIRLSPICDSLMRSIAVSNRKSLSTVTMTLFGMKNNIFGVGIDSKPDVLFV